MDSHDLRVFEAVARLGAMNRAAEALSTVQSNVTARVRALEAELGLALFRRHSRGVELTQAGLRLLPYALRSAQLIVDAKRSVQDDGTPAGRLALGSLETTAALRLSPILSRYAAKYPRVEISLKTAANDELIRRVVAHELDGAFVCGPVWHLDLVGDVAFLEELVMASAPGRIGGTEITPGCKILVKGPGCAYRVRFEALLAAMGIRDIGRMEFGTLDAIIGCVESGLGITLLPKSLLQAASDAGRIRLSEVPPEIGQVETLFIRRKDCAEFSGMRALLSELLDNADAGMASDSVESNSNGGRVEVAK